MDVVLQKDVIYRCSVDAIVHPKTGESNVDEIDKQNEVWTVFKTYIKKDSHYEPRTCAGMAPALSVGDNVTLIGDLVDTGTYGIQFKFSALQKHIPTERQGVINFLVKNVNGIGQMLAEKIVDAIGCDVVEKVRANPNVLSQVNGISKIRAQRIKEQLDGMEASLDELKFWAKTGLGSSRVAAVKSTYEEIGMSKGKPINVIKLIEKNPYQLIDDVKGIGFKVADAVALNIGFPKTDRNRVMAGLEFALKDDVETKGNTWINKDELIRLASSKTYLNIDSLLVRDVLEEMIADGRLIDENDRTYLPHYHELELEIAKKIHSIQTHPTPILTEVQIEQGIARAEQAKERTLDIGQKAAVINSINNNFSIITGGPGVGKTTTLDILLYFLENECGMNITMAAPTGRAAKRMTEQTGRNASTIHALSSQKDRKDFKAGIKRQVLVIDESSMVDINVMKMTLDLCDESTKVVFVGDVDQLPSIGPGQILRDMIDSNVVTTSRLTTIHRQSADSHIIINAHLCINGKHLEKEGTTDFFITERDSEEACLKSLVNYVIKVYPTKLGVPSSDIQVLAPLRRGALGVNNLNKVLQEAINPPATNKREFSLVSTEETTVLREGDRVIQNKNDYDVICEDGTKGVFNGEIGVIQKIINYFGEISIFVQFSDKCAIYDSHNIRNLSLAYAITIHKSQGSEFPAVILPLFSYGMPTIYNRNLLYTAITRAKAYECIIGKRETINKMIHNNKINKRRTTLSNRLNGTTPRKSSSTTGRRATKTTKKKEPST